MTSTKTGSGSADRIIESFRDTRNTALESVRKFLDTVNGVFPDVGARRPSTPVDHRFGVQDDRAACRHVDPACGENRKGKSGRSGRGAFEGEAGSGEEGCEAGSGEEGCEAGSGEVDCEAGRVKEPRVRRRHVGPHRRGSRLPWRRVPTRRRSPPAARRTRPKSG